MLEFFLSFFPARLFDPLFLFFLELPWFLIWNLFFFFRFFSFLKTLVVIRVGPLFHLSHSSFSLSLPPLSPTSSAIPPFPLFLSFATSPASLSLFTLYLMTISTCACFSSSLSLGVSSSRKGWKREKKKAFTFIPVFLSFSLSLLFFLCLSPFLSGFN